ncbi:platelet endothelial cell adhesion molecule isoform X2 [Echeneis naucrates]|uniref:Platelet endothelial cell adhesion molecule n=1 Tax=Echeneis naucrates TaxID=173247 RepID=A0A665V5A5_ECHNA|nr:platelet endothelial cell adhesion molecule-like isoform X2 [Echeneis naucrates]
MDSRPPSLRLVLIITTFLHLAQCVNGQSLLTIDGVFLAIRPNTSVQSGTPVSVNCHVSVSHDNIPNLTHTFQFRRDDAVIGTFNTSDDSVTYELNPARAADSGNYDCHVIVLGKHITSRMEKLNVTGLQTPILYLNKATVYEGDDFTATCSAPEERGSLVFHFFQVFGNKKPTEMKQVAPTGNSSETTLVLREVGNYTLHCNYEINLVSGTRKSKNSNKIQVEVEGLRISPEMNVLPFPDIFEGDIVEAVCKVKNSLKNVEVFLTKDKRILKKGIVGLSHPFKAQEVGSGKLVCKAEFGNVQKKTYQEIIVKELFSKPKLTVNPDDLFVGKRFKLTCSVTVYEPKKITNKNMQFSIYRNNVKIAPSQMLITEGNQDKTGNYTCKVKTVSLVHNFVKESETVVVKVKVYPTKPVMSVVGGTLILGKSFQMRCHSEAGTLPITYKLFGPRDLNEKRLVSKPGEEAIFNASGIRDSSDLKKFICHANNSQFMAPVVGSWQQLPFSTFIIEPVTNPVLIIGSSMGDVSEGQDVTLTCSVQKGTLPVNFTWYHTQKESPLNSQTFDSLQGSYIIYNVKGDHKGGYYCVSNNLANEAKRSSIVMITVKLAGWKRGLIGVLCILLMLALILFIALKKKSLLHFKRKRTDKLSVKSASTKMERLSLTQAEVNEAANVTPGMMGKSVWSEHVSGSESDDQISVTATEPQYKEVTTRQGDPNEAAVETSTDTGHNEERNSEQGVPEQADGGSVEYAELNHDMTHHDDHDGQCGQDDHVEEIGNSNETNTPDIGE